MTESVGSERQVGLGILVGLLIAPQTGPELRARLLSRLSESRTGGLPRDEDLSL